MHPFYIILAGLLALSTGCGGSATSSGSGSGSGGGGSEATNALAVVYPDDLAIASLTASVTAGSSSVSALVKGSVKAVEAPTEKVEDLESILNAEDEEGFQTALEEMKDKINIFATAPSATCYGPTLDYTNHPGGGSGQLPSGDLGIWTETETSTGEACVAAKLNNIIGKFENLINAGTQTAAAVLGAANLEGVTSELPDEGETVEMTTAAAEMLEAAEVPIDLSSATLARGDDTADGDPVFVTEFEGDMLDQAGTDVDATMTTTFEHIPMGDETQASVKYLDADSVSDETYCGRLTQSVSIPSDEVQGGLGNCGGANGITRCVRVDYCKDSETSLTYHLRTGEFCGMDKDCGLVDPDDKYDAATNTDGWGNNFYYSVCNVNPVDGSGDCAQSWQAGPLDGNTRVLNVTVDAGGDSGCGYFGYGPDVGADSGVGSIDRIICNWAGPGNSHTGVALAQRQCFTRNDDGEFVSDPSNLAITYAPTNNCNKTAGVFTYQVTGDATTLVAGGTAVTNNLINLADVDFTVPTLPDVPLD